MEFLDKTDKKKLRVTSKYIKSLGYRNGMIDFHFYENYFPDLSNEIPFQGGTFSNHHDLEIPEFLNPVIDKILKYCDDNSDSLKNRIEMYDLNYTFLEILIDATTETLTVGFYWGYYEEGGTDGTSWSYDVEEEKESIEPLFNALVENDIDTSTPLILRYNGSGDSGYIENNFEDGQSVPSIIEDWCYRELESLHGGWEINEGSSGFFEFDVNNKLVELSHTYMTEVEKSDTIIEENFDK